MKTSSWRKIHRWAGLLLTGFIIFYCITGILLNHRKTFNYFQDRHKSVVQIDIQNQKLLQDFINTYKQQINRDDDPKVIRIKPNGVVEFLYGSHGRSTYTIDPTAGTMTRVDKSDKQPWHWLGRLHKAYKTNSTWLVLTDIIGLLIILLTFTGLITFRYTRRDFLLLAGGLILLILGMLAS